jgi:multidrug efflux pump subunit AcrA (membrane-fusion protein)
MSSAASAEPAPERAVAKQVEPSPAGGKHRAGVLLLAFIAVAAGAWFLWPKSKPATAPGVRTAKTQRGPLRTTIRLTGSVGARNFRSVIVPRLQGPDTGRGLVLIYLVGHGDQVKQGDVIARIDGQSIRDHLVDVESQLTQAKLEVSARKARLASEYERLRQSSRTTLASYESALQDSRALEVKPAVDQELTKLAVQQAEASYEVIREELETLWDRQATQLRVADLDLLRQLRHRDRHLNDINRMEIRASMSGRAILRTTYRNGQERQVKLGDELHSGEPFLRIVDLKTMEMDAVLNQAEIELVRTGQPAFVRFDAYPDLVMNGKVESVGAIATGGRQTQFYIRSVPVRIAIEGSDPRIVPDISASADVVIASQPDAIIAPREAIQDAHGHHVVYVKEGDGFVKREVEIGAQSNTQTAIKSGLEEGEEIALQVPGV